jgi:catechol 2,3-dioxygenase-like lactoylglutathione lyase family enzyme
MTAPRLHHVAISTPDADRLMAFYRDLLGFELVYGGAWPQGNAAIDALTALEGSSARQVMLRAGNAYLELFQFSSPAAAPGAADRPVCDHGITHLCLLVDDVDDEQERLRAAGVPFHSAPQDLGQGVRTTYARDPDGNIVELKQLSSPRHPVALPALAAGA